MENFVVHKANERGSADYGWLKAKHSFSFANFYDTEKIHFGALRVLNDDTIAGATGFGTHPHDNMEIITIPLEGTLEHKDSMGNTGVIEYGEVQVMSAGRGLQHSEKNKNSDKLLKLLQIWIFPNKRNVEPRYDQKKFNEEELKNNLINIVSPYFETNEGLWIYQNAWLSMGNFDNNKTIEYKIKKPNNGVYVFVIEGSFTINNHEVLRRDAIGLWNIDVLNIKANSDNCKILLLDVPMEIN